MPQYLEVGLLCKQFKTHPGTFGFDSTDPKLVREIKLALDIFETASDRHNAKKKIDWDKKHPEGARLLKWARGQSEPEVDPQNFEVQVPLPKRP